MKKSEIEFFQKEGYLLCKKFFDPKLVQKLADIAHEDGSLTGGAFGRDDGDGGVSLLNIFNLPERGTIYGEFGLSKRIYEAAASLLGGDVYHYHTKFSLKAPFTGGQWNWHQDYGYWYDHGVLRPDMLSVFVALDPCTVENGALQLLGQSHLMGRVEHRRTGEQAGGDPERVAMAQKIYPSVHALMEIGDVFFMHSLVLHASQKNRSPLPRWLFICAFNRVDNPLLDGGSRCPHASLEQAREAGAVSNSPGLLSDETLERSTSGGLDALENSSSSSSSVAKKRGKFDPNHASELIKK